MNIEPLLQIEWSKLRWLGHISRMPQEASQTSFTCESRRKAGGMTINMLGRLHWGSWMEPVGASTMQNVGSGGGPQCVVAQSWAAASATLIDMSRLRRDDSCLTWRWKAQYACPVSTECNFIKNLHIILYHTTKFQKNYNCLTWWWKAQHTYPVPNERNFIKNLRLNGYTSFEF